MDEYQDTNEVQNAIFRAVSREGKNLFTVGDVKQSIYRFRLADPTIFLDKYRRFPPAEEAADGENRKILLVQKLPLPAERFWTRPTSSSPTSCPRRWGRWTTARTSRCTSARSTIRPRKDCDTEFHLICRWSEVGGGRPAGETAAGGGPVRGASVSASCWMRAIPSPGRTARCGPAARRTS